MRIIKDSTPTKTIKLNNPIFLAEKYIMKEKNTINIMNEINIL